jgi:ABC-type transporter Mla MlaB component
MEEKMKPEIGQLESMRTAAVSCGESLVISTVHDLHDSLKQSLVSGLPIELDASLVESVDAAAMQLLCAFARDASSSGHPIRWYRPTQVLIDAAKLLQVHALLALPADEPTTKD